MRGALVLLVATFTAGVASSAAAQQPAPGELPLSNSVQILTAARLAALGDSLPAGPSSFRHISRFDGLTNMISRRDSSGVHERHEGFTDIFVVQRGRARLRYGGTVEGERATSPGEWRGGTIQNGSESEIGPGDVVVIPAGIPHQLLLPPGDSFRYFVFKVAKQR